MKQRLERLKVRTEGRQRVDVTAGAKGRARQRARRGLVTVFVRHTSASVIVQENADPPVLRDMERFFARLVPAGRSPL